MRWTLATISRGFMTPLDEVGNCGCGFPDYIRARGGQARRNGEETQ
jgi:hypothetical protein